MPITLSEPAIERSTYAITVPFVDEAGASVTPTAATWTLLDKVGAIVNSRNDVVITPATTVTIVLSGADLALDAAYSGKTRIVLVEWTFNSSIGTGLPGKDNIRFTIADLVGVP